MRSIQGMTDYEFQRKDSERTHSELVALNAKLINENIRLKSYRTAFIKLGAEIANSRCCEHERGARYAGDPSKWPTVGNCMRERLVTLFLRQKRMLKGEAKPEDK